MHCYPFGFHLVPSLILLHRITREEPSNPKENLEEKAHKNGPSFCIYLHLKYFQLKCNFISTLGFSVDPPVVLSYTNLGRSLLWPYPLSCTYQKCLFTNVSYPTLDCFVLFFLQPPSSPKLTIMHPHRTFHPLILLFLMIPHGFLEPHFPCFIP